MKTALIGGGSKGLGFGCAQALAARGDRVILCSRGAADLETAAESLKATGKGEVVTIPCDFSKQDSLEALKAEIETRGLQIDILINNVGGPPPGLVTDVSEADWEKGLDLLFRSTLRLYNWVLPGMRSRRWGRIINILSTTALEPAPTLAVSSVLRSALASYAKLVALEVGKDGVTVNSIMPGGFRTARTEALLENSARAQNIPVDTLRDQIVAGIPIRRWIEPDDLGQFVAFLTSEAGGGMTGTLVPFDGGQKKSI